MSGIAIVVTTAVPLIATLISNVAAFRLRAGRFRSP